MIKRDLFTSSYYECPRCDDPEPLDPRGDSDVLPDWNCQVSEYHLKEIVKKYLDAYPQFSRLKSEYKVGL